MILLLSTIEIPETKHQLPPSIKEYHQFRRHLYSSDGIENYKDQNCHRTFPTTFMPVCPTCCPPGHISHGIKGGSINFLAWHHKSIQATRANCSHCNRMAPSQAALPPTPPTLPEYPFQCICADYFHYQSCTYLVIIDRYSNWPIVERAKDGAQGLTNILRHTFATYSIPDELSPDGGPEFIPHTTRQFLHNWGIHHHLSSVAFPHSNCRAELGVNTIKRLITGNIRKDGAINIDAFQKAILQYGNTPRPYRKTSKGFNPYPDWKIPPTSDMEGFPEPKRRGIKTPSHASPRQME